MTLLALASTSINRAALLRSWGYSFDVEASNVREARAQFEAPRTLVRRLALEKCLDVVQRRPDSVVLAADTVLCDLDEAEVFGKPVDESDAYRMLTQFAGSRRVAITAVCMRAPWISQPRLRVAITQVAFADLTDSQIRSYLATGEAVGRAGSFAIQGQGRQLVDSIEGCVTNVVGLPMCEVGRMVADVSEELRPRQRQSPDRCSSCEAWFNGRF